MRIYSQTSISFVNRLKNCAREILTSEVGLETSRQRFTYGDRTYPLHIVCFEDQRQKGNRQLGYFCFHSYTIGINRCLMYQVSDQFLLNVLRHELAHYITWIEYGHDAPHHGREYRSVCQKAGWGAEVFKAKVNPEELPQSLKENLEDTKILQKIQKLLALGDSPNSHEAELATVKANELLVKYNLQKTLLDGEEEEYCVEVVARTPRINATLQTLASVLNNFFVLPVFSRDGQGSSLEIAGTRLNVKLASYVAAFLLQEFERLWKEARRANPQLRGLVGKNSFLRGIAKGLNQKLQKSQKTTTTGKDLMVMKSNLKKIEEIVYPSLQSTANRRTVRHDPSAAKAGEEAGKNISIHPGLAQNKTQKIRQIEESRSTP